MTNGNSTHPRRRRRSAPVPRLRSLGGELRKLTRGSTRRVPHYGLGISCQSVGTRGLTSALGGYAHMTPVTHETLQEAVAILAIDGISDEEIESKVGGLVSEPMVAKRLIHWIPEAFAMAFISHIAKVQLPSTFIARNVKGRWQTFALIKEPIFTSSLQIARQMCHDGPLETLKNVASRGCHMDAVNQCLSAGGSLDGAVLGGPALLGVPAEVYQDQTVPFWRRLFS